MKVTCFKGKNKEIRWDKKSKKLVTKLLKGCLFIILSFSFILARAHFDSGSQEVFGILHKHHTIPWFIKASPHVASFCMSLKKGICFNGSTQTIIDQCTALYFRPSFWSQKSRVSSWRFTQVFFISDPEVWTASEFVGCSKSCKQLLQLFKNTKR